MLPLNQTSDTTSSYRRSVKHLMNTQIQVIHPDDSLQSIIKAFDNSRLDTLPVVNEHSKQLVGVFPKGSLYDALLDGKSLSESCSEYVIYSPIVNYSEQVYDQVSMVDRVNKSKAGNVPVLDPSGMVVGMIGKLEYLRETLNLTIESYALLESTFIAMYEGMIVVDTKGCILRINQSAENMLGVKFQEVAGQHIQQVFPEIKYINEARSGVKMTLRSIPVIINQVPIIENGKPIGMNMAFLDLSDVEQIADELEMVKELETTLSGVLNASSDGLLVSDKNGSIRYVNEMAGQLFGASSENILGHAVEELIHSNLPVQVAETGIAEVDIYRIKGKNCIACHVPFKEESSDRTVGVITTVYLAENKVAEEIAQKWLSLRKQVQYYREELAKHALEGSSFDQIVSKSPDFIKMKREAQRIARSSSTILLTGESGVGKDLFARAIHAASPRAKRPFVKVNSAAIPETLFESELFGYEPGSFTGASKKGKPGYFEQAHHGTIFLDEIGDMPLSIQVKILQVIQEKQFMRVGGTSSQSVDVRIIAATNRDLRGAIARGEFREDLYYRLNVIELNLPALRARSEDILPLAEMFIQKYNHILGSNIIGLNKEAQKVLQLYSWPGNIRELENAIERAANYAWEGEVRKEHLPSHILRPLPENPEASSYKEAINDLDRDIILDALRKTGGNKSAAAKLLKISRSAFYEKLSKHGLS